MKVKDIWESLVVVLFVKFRAPTKSSSNEMRMTRRICFRLAEESGAATMFGSGDEGAGRRF